VVVLKGVLKIKDRKRQDKYFLKCDDVENIGVKNAGSKA